MADEGFRLVSVLLCDDIRREDNGKAILIGVYSGDVVVPRVPATLLLSVWLEGRAIEGAQSIEIRTHVFVDSEGDTKEVGARSMPLDIEPQNDFTLALSRIPVEILGPGHLSLQLKYGERDWAEMIKKKILVASPGATEQPQPS